MNKAAQRLLLDGAGRLFVLRQELASLRIEQARIEDRIKRVEQKMKDAESAFESIYERAVTHRAGHGASEANGADEVTPGKLPHRVLLRMRQAPAQIYTAAELRDELRVRDIQQIRTALARLVAKGLVRRIGPKGQFTV